MVAPGGNEQEGLADRIPSLACAFKKEAPDRLTTGRSSRLARRLCRDPRALERRHEKAHLSRLTSALPALDRDKPAARHGFRLLTLQRRWPQTRYPARVAIRPQGFIRSTLAAAMRGASTGVMFGTVITTFPTVSPF